MGRLQACRANLGKVVAESEVVDVYLPLVEGVCEGAIFDRDLAVFGVDGGGGDVFGEAADRDVLAGVAVSGGDDPEVAVGVAADCLCGWVVGGELVG